MAYSLQARHAAGAALIALQNSTVKAGSDFGEALTAALSTIVAAMICEGATEDVIMGAVNVGVEWSVETPEDTEH